MHTRNYRMFGAQGFFLNAARCAAAIAALGMGLAGCGSSKPAEQPAAEQPAAGPQRYHLEGRVVSIDPAKQQVTVDHGDIPGFMAAMQMPYPVKDPGLLKPLSPEDQIKADVVVNGNDVYLENITVTKKADKAKPAAPASSQQPK